MQAPRIEQYGRSWFQFTWADVRIEATQIHEHSTDASITGRIIVTLAPPDFRQLLHSTAWRPTYIKSIELVWQTLARKYTRLPPAEWKAMIEYIAEAIQERLALPEALVEVSSDAVIPPMQYLIEPLLPLRDITILFGEGGSLKSYIALMICIAARIGYKFPDLKRLGMLPPSNDNLCQSLWLDYETDQSTFNRRLKYLVRGHGMDPVRLCYLRCSIPLTHDLDAIAKHIRDNNIGLVVVDSMGMAAGGDITTQAIASGFFLALRSLQTTALVITHEAKEQQGKFFGKQKKTPYGSVYVTNAGRSVWRVEKRQDVDEAEANVLVTHMKANDSAYSKPLSYRVVFGHEINGLTNRKVQTSTQFTWIDPSKVKEFEAKAVPLKSRITNYLGENGQVSLEELLELETDKKQVNARLSELIKAGEVQELRDPESKQREYRLLYKELPF